MKKIVLIIMILLLSIQLIAASVLPYPCWDKNGIQSGDRLPEGDNITIIVRHIPPETDPTKVTFTVDGPDGFQSTTIDINNLTSYYELYSYQQDTIGFRNCLTVNYTFNNLPDGIYTVGGYSALANGAARAFVECYGCDTTGCVIPTIQNKTNIRLGPPPPLSIITITPFITASTNQDITVFATVINGVLDTTQHTFTSNGNFIFSALNVDKIKTLVQVNITNIDKIIPVITSLTYSTTALTNNSVIATININEDIIESSNRTLTHTFTSNGDYTFIFTDLAGNQGSIAAHVSNIDETISILNTYNYSMQIRITHPENKTYTTNVTEMKFIVDSTNKTAKQCWYTNETFTSAKATCDVDITYSVLNLGLLEGKNEWRVYVEDSMGRINSSSVIFYIDRPLPVVSNVSNNYNTTPVVTLVPITPITTLPIEEPAIPESEKPSEFWNSIKDNYKQILLGGLLLVGSIWLVAFIIINRRPGDKRLIYAMENLVLTDTNNGNVRIYSNHINDTYMDVTFLTTPNKENLSFDAIGKVEIVREGKDIYEGGRSLSFPFKYLFKNRKEYSHIWCYTSRASSFWSMLIKKVFNKKLIVKCDNVLLDPNAKLARKIWQYLTIKLPLKNADFVIAESDGILNEISTITNNAHMIPNCVSVTDLSKLKINNPKENTMISIGRLEPIKGLLDLIDAFFLFKELPGKEDWILKIVGPLTNKEYIKILNDRVIELNMQKYIYITGPLFNKELYQEMAKAKIYIIASHPNGDGKNNTLPYTMYYGCQPIVTDVGDLKDTIAPLNIKPVPPENVNTLAKAMKYYSKYPTDTYKLKRYIENNLDWDIYLPLFEELFNDEQKEDSFSK